jgi:hypothetical protein
MSRLLRLYPRAWRERYGDEFVELIREKPPTSLDTFDVVRGALDAWLHPQTVGQTPSPAPGGARTARLARAGAIAGGGLWIAAGLAMNSLPIDPDLGYKNADIALLVIVAAMVVTALAALATAGLPAASRYAGIAAVAILLGAVLTAMPWPVLIIGVFGYILATAAFGAILALRAGQAVGGLLAVAALVLSSMNTEDERALLTIPIGLAWIAVGALAIGRVPAAARA